MANGKQAIKMDHMRTPPLTHYSEMNDGKKCNKYASDNV